MSRLAQLKRGNRLSSWEVSLFSRYLSEKSNYGQTLPPRVCITAYVHSFALQEFRLHIWVGNVISFFCTWFLPVSGILMIEESWLSVILKVIPGAEAKERVAIKAVALYPQKSSGKAEGSSGDRMTSGVYLSGEPRAQLDDETGCVSWMSKNLYLR